ncbi:MAG: cytochrome c peroxidase [Amphritea sp.]
MKMATTVFVFIVLVGIQVIAISASAANATLPKPIRSVDYQYNGVPAVAKVELGRLLFFDKILSGNKNISCATCHHPSLASGDGMAMPFGEGPRGLGPERKPGNSVGESVHSRVPRNSPALFNLGAHEFTRLFHDGRVELDKLKHYESGFISPAKWKLPSGLDSVLAAQAMFPVASATEMAGNPGENPIADAVFANNVAGSGGVWQLLAQRLKANESYVMLFKQAFPRQVMSAGDVHYVMVANAIAAFEGSEFRSDTSPFDAYLSGNENSLSASARRGMMLFYGEAGCANCHSGKFQTDHDFHAIAMPQIGPGKNDGYDADYWRTTGLNISLEDYGRGRVTQRHEDRYKFRTPSLRNVALTGPWGHSGAYNTLEDVVRHHLDPVASLQGYKAAPELLPAMGAVLELTGNGSSLKQTRLRGARRVGYLQSDTWVQNNSRLREKIAAANELRPISLAEERVQDLVSFLESLTDQRAAAAQYLVPVSVPSGLPVID